MNKMIRLNFSGNQACFYTHLALAGIPFFYLNIITVIFASTLVKTSNNINMVQQQVQHSGGTITDK
jgi:hypothetical protein